MTGYVPFVVAAALLAVVTVAVLLQPWWRRSLRSEGEARQVDDRRTINAAIYRDQLAELDRDVAAGVLSVDDATIARDEIKRRLLADTDTADAPRPPAPASRKPTAWLAIALLVPLSAASLYLQLGSPTLVLDRDHQAKAALSDMQTAVEKLAARLDAEPDNPEGWAMLARSYGAMGRWDDASQAFARVGPTLESNAALLAAAAEIEFRRAGDRFTDPARSRIAQALKVDANNPHALLLAASDAMREARWPEAAVLWERLLGQLEPGSDDAREIEGMLAQARERGGQPATTGAPGAAAASSKAKPGGGGTAAFVTGRVELDPRLVGKVRADDTVFVFARAVAEGNVPAPRMPLAALKLRVADLPREFRLDDAMAMDPSLTISRFRQVRIEARVAKGGGATPVSGDPIGASDPVKPGTRGIVVRIDAITP